MQGPGGSLTPAPSPPPPGGHPSRASEGTPSRRSARMSASLDSDHLDDTDSVGEDDDEADEDDDEAFVTSGAPARTSTVVEDDRMMMEDQELGVEELTRRSTRSHGRRDSHPEASSSTSGVFLSRLGLGGSGGGSRSSRAVPSGSSGRRQHGGFDRRGGSSSGAGLRGEKPLEGAAGQAQKILDLNGYAVQLTFDPFLEVDSVTASSAIAAASSGSESVDATQALSTSS